eukprot:3545157-Rhodomonas_salina.1
MAVRRVLVGTGQPSHSACGAQREERERVFYHFAGAVLYLCAARKRDFILRLRLREVVLEPAGARHPKSVLSWTENQMRHHTRAMPAPSNTFRAQTLHTQALPTQNIREHPSNSSCGPNKELTSSGCGSACHCARAPAPDCWPALSG